MEIASSDLILFFTLYQVTGWKTLLPYYRDAGCTIKGASNSVSSYYVAHWGGLYLVDGAADKTDMSPVDIVVASNIYHVYVLTPKDRTIGEYKRKLFGGLEGIGTLTRIPISSTGLAIY